MDRKIATPLMVLNYVSMLQQQNKFEDSFKVFERAINIFQWPNSYEIWLTYISTFIQVVGGTKVERVRHLFEECLSECPSDKQKTFLLMYADYEENFGLLSHAMEIYERAATKVTDNNIDMWNVYLSKVMQYYGASRCRSVYQKALKVLQGTDLVLITLRFAKLERKLNEHDRARAIYLHLSQYCNPAIYEDSFWKVWESFELQFGNKDTYEDLLRAKRSQELRYSVINPLKVDQSDLQGEVNAVI